MKDNNEVLKLFIVSDSIGETAQRMIHATLTQFPDLTQVEIKKFPYIKDEQEFLNVLQLAKEQNAIVATTLVSESFNALGHQFANEHQIPYVDYMSELISIIKQHTSKTPLSMYLANKGYKIANIPLVPEVAIPDNVFQQKNLKVFGLTASPNYIANIRRNRAETLGLSSESNYNSLERIKKELSYAEEVFRKLNATVINTEYKSIEESAFYIEKFLAKR